MNLDFQITKYPKSRENKNKCNPEKGQIDKTSYMKNKLRVSTYIKTITEKTDQYPYEKHTVQM